MLVSGFGREAHGTVVAVNSFSVTLVGMQFLYGSRIDLSPCGATRISFPERN